MWAGLLLFHMANKAWTLAGTLEHNLPIKGPWLDTLIVLIYINIEAIKSSSNFKCSKSLLKLSVIVETLPRKHPLSVPICSLLSHPETRVSHLPLPLRRSHSQTHSQQCRGWHMDLRMCWGLPVLGRALLHLLGYTTTLLKPYPAPDNLPPS